MTVDISTEPHSEPDSTEGSQPADEQAQPVDGGHRYQGMISVDRLRPHPEHVREDLALDDGFLASIEELGVVDPILITPDPEHEGDFLVIDGHRRVGGAEKAGEKYPERKFVPFFLDADGASDRALQHLKQYITNDDQLGKSHGRWEQLTALRLAEEAGASRTLIRKATGLKRDQVTQALKISKLSTETRQAIDSTRRSWDLEDMALIAEFEDDQEACERILRAKDVGYPKLSYVIEKLRDERAEAAEHERLVAELHEAGVPVTPMTPDGGLRLSELRVPGSEDEELTFDQHRDCPGRGAYFAPYTLTTVVHYCDDPHKYRHQYRDPEVAQRMQQRAELVAAGRSVTAHIPDDAIVLSRLEHDGQDLTADNHIDCPGAGVRVNSFDEPAEYCIDPRGKGHSLKAGFTAADAAPADPVDRGLIVRGNKAWPRAAKLRQEELKTGLLARRTTGKGSATLLKAITAFLSEELLRWPMHLSESHASASAWMMFTQLTGRDKEQALAELETAGDGRRLMLMLALVIAGYETEMAGDRDRRFTWRTDGKSNPYCTREDAGRYLRFLSSQGYELSPIEKAVADGVPYTEDEDAPVAAPSQPENVDQPEQVGQSAGEPTTVTGETDDAAHEARGIEEESGSVAEHQADDSELAADAPADVPGRGDPDGEGLPAAA